MFSNQKITIVFMYLCLHKNATDIFVNVPDGYGKITISQAEMRIYYGNRVVIRRKRFVL